MSRSYIPLALLRQSDPLWPIAQASIVGKRIGRLRWSTSSGKTVEGSVAFFLSLVLAGTSLSLTGIIESFSVSSIFSPFTDLRAQADSLWNHLDTTRTQVTRYTILSLALSLMEAFSEQNDNLILPIWGWCLGVCVGL